MRHKEDGIRPEQREGKRNEVERYVISSCPVTRQKGDELKGAIRKGSTYVLPFLLRLKCEVAVVVEVTGFEPMASWSRTKRATNCATPRYATLLYKIAAKIATKNTPVKIARQQAMHSRLTGEVLFDNFA